VPGLLAAGADAGGIFTGGYGSGADSRDASVLLDARAGQFAIHADGFDRRADDYSIPGGTQANSYIDSDGYSLGGSYFFGDDHIGVGAVHYDSKYGIPSDTTYIDMKRDKRMRGRRSRAVERRSSARRSTPATRATNTQRDRPGHGRDSVDVQGRRVGRAGGERVRQDRSVLGSALGGQFQQDFSALGDGANTCSDDDEHAGSVRVRRGAARQVRAAQTGARVERVDIDGTPASDVPTSRGFTPVSGSLGVLLDAACRLASV
jgi:iron complex outermembrane receptor protein